MKGGRSRRNFFKQPIEDNQKMDGNEKYCTWNFEIYKVHNGHFQGPMLKLLKFKALKVQKSKFKVLQGFQGPAETLFMIKSRVFLNNNQRTKKANDTIYMQCTSEY